MYVKFCSIVYKIFIGVVSLGINIVSNIDMNVKIFELIKILYNKFFGIICVKKIDVKLVIKDIIIRVIVFNVIFDFVVIFKLLVNVCFFKFVNIGFELCIFVLFFYYFLRLL